ncbi:MAG: ABC transporter permease, partial [Planctomycetota bacterium]
MNAQHIWWIFRREMRDQLRDRRTLFMVAVLPVLMYPLLGSSFFQLSQFMRQHTGRVLLLGAAELTGTEQDSSDFPPLVVDGAFNAELFSSPLDAKRLEVVPPTAAELDAEDAVAAAQGAVKSGRVDVAVVVPEGFAERLRAAREAGQGDADRGPPPELALPVHHDAAREQSQVARLRVDDLLRRWQAEVVRANLAASNVPDAATNPFSVQTVDVATKQRRDAVLWSKLLPFVVFIWALTGAFYPAIDLCAGEKERGTLETLLSSPARRSEIVVGKLLTIMAFSIFTACLNLASLSLTAKVLIGQLAGMMGGGALAPPAWSAIAWLLVALVPIAALFSALSLACASFAKSTKEGQYYFMPLFLGATPLMLAPMSPGVELTLGNALVPVMGLVLLLRALIEGQLALAGTYALPVVAVTTACAWLATRWAVHQFNQESVLFREGERFDLRTQVAAWMRDRGATPSAAVAISCVGLIFFAQFVTRWLTPPPVLGESGLGYFATLMIVGQVACIALPAVLVATTLARDWRRTLLLD